MKQKGEWKKRDTYIKTIECWELGLARVGWRDGEKRHTTVIE